MEKTRPQNDGSHGDVVFLKQPTDQTENQHHRQPKGRLADGETADDAAGEDNGQVVGRLDP